MAEVAGALASAAAQRGLARDLEALALELLFLAVQALATGCRPTLYCHGVHSSVYLAFRGFADRPRISKYREFTQNFDSP